MLQNEINIQVGTLRFDPTANIPNVLEALSSSKIVSLNQLMKDLLCFCNTLIMFIFGWVTMTFFVSIYVW